MTLIELIWTITPALILIAITFPSFRLLYLLDEVTSPTVTIKVTGHQWYWSILIPLNLNFKGDSHTLNSNIQNSFLSLINLNPLSLLLNNKHLELQNRPYRSYSVNHDNTNSIFSKGLN